MSGPFIRPYRFATTPFAPEEWVLAIGSSNAIKYFNMNIGAGSATDIASLAQLNAGTNGIATDGTFVFVSTSSSNMGQYAWNGSALTQRLSAAPASPPSNGFPKEYYIMPGNANRIMYAGGEDFGDGLGIHSFTSSPTYSYANRSKYEGGTDPWTGILDFRVGAVGTAGYGNTIVAVPGNSSSDLRSFTASGSTISTYGSVSSSSAAGAMNFGQDRDSGRFAGITGSSSSVYIFQLDMSSRVPSSIGTGTATGSVWGLTWCDDKLITLQGASTAGTLNVYTVSGSTLTHQSALSIGGSPNANDWLMTSPFTNCVYLGQSNVAFKAYQLSGTTLTLKCTSGYTAQVDGVGRSMAFLAAALPTV